MRRQRLSSHIAGVGFPSDGGYGYMPVPDPEGGPAGGSGSGDEGGDGDGDEGGEDGDEDGNGSEDRSQGDPRIKKLSDESARYRRERNEKDAELEKVKAQLKKYTDAELGELGAAKGTVEELTATTTAQAAAIKELRLNNAFLSDNTYDWADPADALKLADLSGVEIDKDGTVTGMKEALDKLAKDKPHLVKAATKDDEDEDDPTKTTSTGAPPKAKGTKEQHARSSLVKKYPALASHALPVDA